MVSGFMAGNSLLHLENTTEVGFNQLPLVAPRSLKARRLGILLNDPIDRFFGYTSRGGRFRREAVSGLDSS